MLFNLLNLYLPVQIKSLLKSINVALFVIDGQSTKILGFLSPFFDYFDYEQSDGNLLVFGLSSGSTFINVLLFMHLVFWLLNYKVKSIPNKSLWTKFVSKSYENMKYGAYVRLTLEAFFLLWVASISEIQHKKHSNGPTMRSLVLSYIFLAMAASFIILCFVNLIMRSTKDHFNSQVKEGFLPRCYSFIFLSRIAIFTTLLLLIDNKFKIYWIFALQILHAFYVLMVRPFKWLQDNIIEVTNDIFYVCLVAFFLYFNNQSKWSATFTALFKSLILMNIMASTVISVSFMIYNLSKKLSWKRKSSQKISHSSRAVSPKKTINRSEANSAFKMQVDRVSAI